MNDAGLPFRDRAAALLAACRAAGLTLATAESCTGGLLAAILTDVAGSSDVFERGLVTYSNAAKSDLLGVPAELIARHGAVSERVARAMADGLMERTPATLGVSVTGVAGPGGGSADKPVGTVHLAAVRRGAASIHRLLEARGIGRSAVREAAVTVAFDLLEEQIRAAEADGQAVP